jgi:hypothetical protein
VHVRVNSPDGTRHDFPGLSAQTTVGGIAGRVAQALNASGRTPTAQALEREQVLLYYLPAGEEQVGEDVSVSDLLGLVAGGAVVGGWVVHFSFVRAGRFAT